MIELAPSQLAVYPALTADHIKVIAAATNSYRNSDKSSVGQTWARDTLFETQFGKNMFTHTVITWEDDLGRTILGLETAGLTERGYGSKDPANPTEDEVKVACDRIGKFIQDVMSDKFKQDVTVVALAPASC